MIQCKFCGNLTNNKTFCTRHCSAMWMTTSQEGRKSFYTARRGRKIAEANVKRFKERPELVEAFRRRSIENPSMRNPETRKKVSETLKRLGHKPKIRGGNGTGPTKAELILKEMFHPHAKCNYAVITGKPPGSGYPQHYKVDVALPDWKLAIEADGRSHRLLLRKEQDAKKSNLLTVLGWTVLRFSNERILEDTQNVKEELRSIILRLPRIQATP